MSSRPVTQSTDRQIQNHAVIILAGGLSQRLGQAKQLLPKNGEPLIAYMVQLAVSTNPHTVVVVVPDRHRSIDDTVTKLAMQHSALQTVINSQPETGMAHSLLLGIETLASLEITSLDADSIERVLIMGVDQVLLDGPHLSALLSGKKTVVASGYQCWQEANNPTSADNKHIIGLPLVINYKLLRQWQSGLMGDKGLRHLIRRLPADQIGTVINDNLSYDIDTPEQLAYAKQQGWLD